MRRIVHTFRPTVVHLQEPFLPTLNSFALGAAGSARTVGTFHTYSEKSRGYLWTWPWCEWINHRLDARIAVSNAAREFASRYHSMNITVVPHGITLPPEPETQVNRTSGYPTRIVFVGRADEPRKGFQILTATMQILERESPGAFILDSLGSGTTRGEVTEDQLCATLSKADICVVPSLGGESFGLVALEALAHGVPVIASKIAGYAEWLDDSGTGALVEPGNVEALVKAVRHISEKSIHAACQARARQFAATYSWNKCVDRTLEIYNAGQPKVERSN